MLFGARDIIHIGNSRIRYKVMKLGIQKLRQSRYKVRNASNGNWINVLLNYATSDYVYEYYGGL